MEFGGQMAFSKHIHTPTSPVGWHADVSFGLHSHSCLAGIHFQEWVEAVGPPPPVGLFVTAGAVLFLLR